MNQQMMDEYLQAIRNAKDKFAFDVNQRLEEKLKKYSQSDKYIIAENQNYTSADLRKIDDEITKLTGYMNEIIGNNKIDSYNSSGFIQYYARLHLLEKKREVVKQRAQEMAVINGSFAYTQYKQVKDGKDKKIAYKTVSELTTERNYRILALKAMNSRGEIDKETLAVKIDALMRIYGREIASQKDRESKTAQQPQKQSIKDKVKSAVAKITNSAKVHSTESKQQEGITQESVLGVMAKDVLIEVNDFLQSRIVELDNEELHQTLQKKLGRENSADKIVEYKWKLQEKQDYLQQEITNFDAHLDVSLDRDLEAWLDNNGSLKRIKYLRDQKSMDALMSSVLVDFINQHKHTREMGLNEQGKITANYNFENSADKVMYDSLIKFCQNMSSYTSVQEQVKQNMNKVVESSHAHQQVTSRQ